MNDQHLKYLVGVCAAFGLTNLAGCLEFQAKELQVEVQAEVPESPEKSGPEDEEVAE